MDKTTGETITILKNYDWNVIDGEACRVLEFQPMGSAIKEGKVQAMDKSTPYASITLECKKYPNKITAYITHKMDFQHLWEAFKERGVKDNEEAIVSYSKKFFKSYAKIFSSFMPKLWITICPKGAFELMTDPENRPELQGEARFLAERPIAEWKPEVMK